MATVQHGLPDAFKEDIAPWFGERASAVDRAHSSAQAGLAFLAERGLLAKGVAPELGGDGGGLEDMIDVISAVAEQCLTSAFVLWSHRVFIEYVVSSDNRSLRRRLLPDLLDVTKLGATGLANAMKNTADLEDIRLRAEPTANNEFVITGSIPWASNLVEQRFIVAVAAQLPRANFLCVAIPSTLPDVVRSEAAPLFALDGTVSGSLRFDNVAVGSEWILSHDGPQFLSVVRPAFLLMQCGLARGIAQAALSSAASKLGGAKTSLAPRLQHLQTHFDNLVYQVRQLSQKSAFTERDFYDVCKARKQLTELAVDAVWLELEAAGGAGYVASSPTARRLREVAFLPVQSPSLIQLRLQLKHLEKTLQIDAAAPAS